MATKSDLIKKVVEGVLEEIKKNAPEEYSKLEADSARKEKILEAVKATARETLVLAEELSGQPKDIAERITKHLPEDRVQLIQCGLSIPTFRMKIILNDDGKYWLQFTREGKEFLPTDELASRFDIDWGITLHYASILIDVVLFVTSAVGIFISPSAYVIKKTVNETAATVRSKSSAKLKQALDDFVGAWDAAGSNPLKMATAFFDLIKESYSTGIIFFIIKILCNDMEWYDCMENSAKATAIIMASLSTNGTALINETALIISSAVDFARKISNVVELTHIKKALQSQR